MTTRRLLFPLFLLAAFFLAPAAFATISITQSNSAETNSVTSQACTLSSTLAAGDLIIVAGRVGGSGTITASDGPGTTYSHAGAASPMADSVGNQVFLMYGVLAAGQSSLTITVSETGAATRLSVACLEYHSSTGWKASPFDISNSAATASASTANPGNITPAASGELVFSTIELNGNPTAGTQAVNSPFTIQKAGGVNGYTSVTTSREWGGDNEGAPNSSQTCTFTWTTASVSASVIAAFKPASSTKPANQFPRVTGFLWFLAHPWNWL